MIRTDAMGGKLGILQISLQKTAKQEISISHRKGLDLLMQSYGRNRCV